MPDCFSDDMIYRDTPFPERPGSGQGEFRRHVTEYNVLFAHESGRDGTEDSRRNRFSPIGGCAVHRYTLVDKIVDGRSCRSARTSTYASDKAVQHVSA